MADPGFDGMDVSIEERILAAFVVLLKADEDIAAEFAPILTLETPTRQAFERIAAGSMAVQPYQVKAADKPSGRSTIRVGLLVSAYLEAEQTEEDSNLLGLRLGNHIRKLAFSNPRLSDTEPLTMSAVEVVQLTTLAPSEGVRILSYRIFYETDIDPATGELSEG